MSNFLMFKDKIYHLGGKWASKDVFFMQTRDSYSAAYKPNYPNGSLQDMIIQTIDRTGAYNRGNYELVSYRKDCNKWMAEYFDTIGQLRDRFE